MSKSCPVGKEWDEFVDGLKSSNNKLSFSDALVAYSIFNTKNNTEDLIPTVEEARNILNNITALEKDEEFVRLNAASKIQKYSEQLLQLGDIYENFANNKQKAALEKIITMTENHIDALNSPITPKTISVSNFIGTSTFKGDPNEYAAFRIFGTFIHDLLEDVQRTSLIKGNVSFKKVFTRDYFNEKLNQFQEKEPFEIKSLDNDKLFLIAQDLVEQINALKKRGYLILPEISVIGSDENGALIVGRIDMLLLDTQGNVKIYDFKTKKVQGLLDEGDDWQVDNASIALAGLSKKVSIYSTKDQPEGTQTKFITGEFGSRSAYDTWAMQINVYKNILGQIGLDVNGHTILSLLYETDEDKNFLGSTVHEFELENYYLYADHDVLLDANGVSYIAKRQLDTRIDKIVALVDKHVPTSKNKKEIEIKTTRLLNEVLQPSEEDYIIMRENIKRLLDKELIEVNNKIKNAKTIAIKKLLIERRDSLMNYKTLLEKMSNEDFDKSINTATTLDYLNSELTFLNEKAEELIEKFNNNQEAFNKNDLKRMDLIYKSSEGLSDIIKVMQRVINEAKDNEENGITELSPAVNMLGDIILYKENISNIKSRIYRQQAVAKILKTPGKKVFDRISEQMAELVTKEIEVLEKEIEDLNSNKGLTILQTMKSKVLQKISSSYKQKLDEKLAPTSPKLALIEEKERMIKVFKSLMAGTFDYTDTAVLAYLDNITNPDSTFYIGSDRVLPYSTLISGSLTNNWVASVANKDLALSGATQFLKNAAAGAVRNAQNDFASSNFDALREKLYRSGRSFEQINKAITERVVIKYRDPNTKELMEREVLSIVAPYTQEYKDTWNSYKAFLKEADFRIRQLKSERNNIFLKRDDASKKRVEELTTEILDAQNDRASKIKAHNQWMIENSSLPYIDEFYTLQKELPVEIAEKLQDLYLELETYRFMQDKKTRTYDDEAIEGDDETTDFDFSRIGEIEDDIRGLREQAKELDPKYAEYISRLDEFYEYDIRYDYYQRQKSIALSKFQNNPEELQRWMEENEITIAKKEWYEELSGLYEELSIYYGSDPVYKDMLDERNKILRKHKYVDGVLRPQYMSDEDVRKYDQIEKEIEEYKNSRKKTKLDEDSVDAINDIFFKIERLKQKDKNKYYTQELDMRFEKLSNRLALVNEYDAQYASLIAKGVTGEELDNVKKLLTAYEVQFDKEESEYKKWYNKNHKNKYKSITKGYGKSNADPKEFNYVTGPAEAVKEQYTETVPHPKYTKRRMKQDAYYVDGIKLIDEQKEELLSDKNTMTRLTNEGRLNFEKGVYNPNYLETPDGIPMPKNIIKVDDNVYAPKPGAGFQNINPRYMELYKDKDLFEFYAAITSMFFELQKQTDGRTLGYVVPGSVSGFVQSLHSEGLISAIKKQKEIFVDKNVRAYGSAQDIDENLFGDLKNSIRLRGNNQFESLIQSDDAISSVMQWVAEAHYNIAMQEAAPVVDAFIDELKSKAAELSEKVKRSDKGVVRDIDGSLIKAVDFEKRLSELDGIIKLAEYERNKFVSGQYEDPSAASRAITKKLKAFFTYTSFIRIGFDVTNQTKNLVAGSIQSYIAACDFQTGHYGKKDYHWANGKMWGFSGTVGQYLKDLGNISDVSDSTMIYRLFNPVQKEFDKYLRDTSGKKSRKVLGKLANINELAYFLQDKGDTIIGMTVMWSVLNSYKYRQIEKFTDDGQPVYVKDNNGDDVYVSAHEAYMKNPDTNELVIRDDVEYTVDDENMLRNIIYSEMRRAQGNYAKSDQVKAEASALGKMVLFFRKYLVPLFMNRFGYMKTNWEAGEIGIGYYRATLLAYRQFGGLQVAKHLLVGGKTLNRFNANTMGKFLTAKVNHTRRDFMAMVILSMLSMSALAWYKKRKEDEPDEDELSLATRYKNVALDNMLRLLWQVKGETNSMSPFATESQTEYIKNFTTGIPFQRELLAGQKLVSHVKGTIAVQLANGGAEPDEDLDSQWYQENWKDAYYSRKSGSFEKGDSKLIKDFIDLTGYRNLRDLVNPENRLEFLQSKQ
jgi:hypothetical protein